MEAYIDDMLIKSHAVSDHIADFKEMFSTLHWFSAKAKSSEVCLRSYRRKISEIHDLTKRHRGESQEDQDNFWDDSAKNSGKVQHFIDMIALLNGFIPRLAKTLSFFSDSQAAKRLSMDYWM